MNKYLLFTIIMLSLSWLAGCKETSNNTAIKVNEDSSVSKEGTKNKASATNDDVSRFLPQGYKIFDTIYGDLNKDGQDDCILIIKGTDKNNIIKDDNNHTLDRNRRGIIFLLNKNGHYDVAVKNYSCFSSENEDGGVYYAPELSVDIDKGNLYLHYAHGRYGYWSYTFRYQDSDFALIGFDASDNQGPVINRETSINYLTKKKIVKENTNENAEGGDEVFKQTVTKMNATALTKLSEIEDFDELDIPL